MDKGPGMDLLRLIGCGVVALLISVFMIGLAIGMVVAS